MIFSNRKHAGNELSKKLIKFKDLNPIVIGLPRGGIPIAAEVSAALQSDLNILCARKIGAPFQPELALGAICEHEDPVWNQGLMARMGVSPDDLSSVVLMEKERIRQQIRLFRNNSKAVDVAGRVVIIADDGLATGSTMLATIKYLKHSGAAKIIVAVPVAAASSVRQLQNKVSEVVAVEVSEELSSVGEWYEDFSQITDEEVLRLLQEFRLHHAGGTSIRSVTIAIDQVALHGDLVLPPSMKAIIVFAHGSGSSRMSPRNRMVAENLQSAGFGTLLFDLLTESEVRDRKNIFDIELLSHRLVETTHWLRTRPGLEHIAIGYFVASTGAAAAIHAASKLDKKSEVFAIVSRGGRPDLAGSALDFVTTPTLLIVGSLDFKVIELNQHAQQSLSHSKLTLVDGATHLFEEPGTLEEVSKLSQQWFENHLDIKKVRIQSKIANTLETAINLGMNKLRNEKDFDRLIQSLKDTRVVMLGESSHGTHEFYELRSQISRRLIKDHGFKFIAIEGDWPDAYRLNQNIQSGKVGSAYEILKHNHRWPTWMWANAEVADLAEWMRKHSAGIYGLDVYSLFESISEVIRIFKKTDPYLAHEIEQRYACFDPFEEDEVSYARSLFANASGCEKEAVQALQLVLQTRMKNLIQDGDELFNAQQNARIVANAETYYRAMLAGDASSWNIRDSHMMDTLDKLLEKSGEDSKCIVWAHNTHIGDYRATDMHANGYINLGGLARQSYGDENVALIGFGTYQGHVLAGSAWGRSEEIMPLPPAEEGSYEHFFHKAALKSNSNSFYIMLEDKAHSAFSQKRGHRAVGVVYNPKHEQRGNYVPTILSKRYDAFIFVDKTHALRSLHSIYSGGKIPDTWPAGI